MDKLESKSLDSTQENINKLKELFPNVVTEGKIDFDALRLVLGDEVETSKEKYQFTWNGKAEAIKLARNSSSSTFRPCKNRSKDWETTKNIYIEGDNLEALKQLQKTFYNKVDIIYIDPPYNTGGDLIYKDDFSTSKKEFLEKSKQGLQSNPNTSGRFHTDWLNMIFPRLMLSRNLLNDTGLIFISIDDNELSNLKIICDSIFGEKNFMSLITCKVKAPSGVASGAQMVFNSSEYMLIYAKNANSVKYNQLKEDVEVVDGKTKTASNYNMVLNTLNYDNLKLIQKFDDDELYEVPIDDFSVELLKDKSSESYYYNRDKIFRVAAMSGGREKIIKNYIDTIPDSIDKLYVYRHTPEKGKRAGQLVDDLIYKKGGVLFLKDFVSVNHEKKQVIKQQHLTNIFNNDWWQGIANEGGVQFKNGKKPLKLLDIVLSLNKKENALILDFFSGSASTAEAVIRKNVIDNQSRRFIMVQIPEKCDEKSEAYQDGYKTICDIGEDRIQKAGEQIKQKWLEENQGEGLFAESKEFPFDIGFKVFKIDSTNIKPWDSELKLDENTIWNQDEIIKEGRSNEDVLYEIMLKYGIFDQQASSIEINGKTMYKVGKRYMIVCLDDNITNEDVKAIGELKPINVVFKENGFKDDNDKINAVYNLTRAGVEEIKCI